MAVSGSTNFSQTRNEVILDSLSLLGVNSVGRTPSAEDVSLANRFLNKMIKAWQAKGLHMWTKEEGILFLTPYVGQYDLGDDNVPFAEKDNVSTSMLSENETAGDTVLHVANTEGMTVNDNFGIVKDDGYIYWTTISSLTSTTVTIPNPGIPVNISQSQLVYSYSTHAGKPMRVLDARTLQGLDQGPLGTDQVETPLTMIPYQSYWNVGMVTTNSTLPNQGMYVPKDLNGRLYIWPRPLNAMHRVQLTYERMIDDMDAVNNTFDFPTEWLEALTFQLAIRLGTPFGKEAKVQSLLPMASAMLGDLLDWDCEVSSITFQPYYEGSGYSSYNGGEGWGR